MRFIVLVFALVLLSCSTSKKATQAIIPDEIVNLDNLEVVPEDQEEAVAAEDSTIEPLPEYKPSYSREIDLLHTKLEVSFDWAKEQVLGKAALVFKPYGYDINRFRLDAKNFIINSVKFGNTNLTYNYDDTNLYIN
ncbi:MAG TPA: alanyl aminopeptidase, partial [Saprospiraceae bacterium]|nr:alanyl aminopeptidase [Saprospiraceae bacterium]